MKKAKTHSNKAKSSNPIRLKRAVNRAKEAKESQQFLMVVSVATVLLVIFLFLILGKNR